MLSEQITVTTTPITIAELLNTARGETVAATKIVGIMLRYDITETAVVTLSDENSVAGAVVLDAATEQLYSSSFRQFDTTKALLSCDTGTVVVHLIAEQVLGH